MKKLILSLALVCMLISCDVHNEPVQSIEKNPYMSDLLVYGDGCKYNPDSTYYLLRTRYDDCRITDCGTYSYIDSILSIRKTQVKRLQEQYERLEEKSKK